MKKLLVVGCLIALFGYASYTLYAGGGDSFIGGFAGGTMGSMMGNAMSRPSGGGDGDGGGRRARKAMNRVDELEDMMRNDFRRLNDRMNQLEERISALEQNVPAA